MKILDPTAPPPPPVSELPKRLPSLAGRTVAVLTNRWKSMDAIAQCFTERLPVEHQVAEVLVEAVPLNGGAPEEVLARVGARAHLAVVGLAN